MDGIRHLRLNLVLRFDVRPIGPSACYGVAMASEACSAASATQVFLRCRPRMAPVTLRTFPTGQDGILHKGNLIGRQD